MLARMQNVAGRVSRATVSLPCLVVTFPLLGLACGGGSETSTHPLDGSASPSPDAGIQPTGYPDGGNSSTDGGLACSLPAAPADVCASLPSGKVIPCNQNAAHPSQTGYLEIDSPGSSPIYVCATSWSSDPAIGYVFGSPATFMSDAQSCCGGSVAAAAPPNTPQFSFGSMGTPRIPDHIKPQELNQPGNGLIRQDPFAVVVTDATSGAAATQAISTWMSWGGDGKPHPAPDGTGAYYFALGFPINYVVLATDQGFPVIVIGPEVSLTANGTTPIGHPSLGVCAAGGGAPLALIGGEVTGTTLNNHSGRFDYGPSATAQALESAAQLFNCMGIQITATKFDAPKAAAVDAGTRD